MENPSTSRWFTMVRAMPELYKPCTPHFLLTAPFPPPATEFQKFIQRKAHSMYNFEKPVVMKVSLKRIFS